MRIVEVIALSNGAHRNQTGEVMVAPPGWAVVPEGLDTQNFPFGEIAVEEVDGVLTVTSWTPIEIPAPEPEPEPEPTLDDISLDLLADHEERLCLLEIKTAI